MTPSRMAHNLPQSYPQITQILFWSAAAWRRFLLDQTRSITKRRQAAALQRGKSFRYL